MVKLEDENELKGCENGERNELFDVGLVGNKDDDDDDVNWDGCDSEFRCLFDQVLMLLLRGVYAKNGIRPIPALLGDGGRSVDLFKLFCLVRDRGGFSAVSKEKLWGLVAEKFGFDSKLSASLKLIYFKYLDELDQWLNRISRDRISKNGSFECGGSLGLLSLEFEKKFREYLSDEKAVVIKDEKTDYDSICKRIDVALRKTLNYPSSESGSESHDGVATTVDDDEKLCESKAFASPVNSCAVDVDSSSRKRKRDIFPGMLGWMIKVAKDPCHPSIGTMPGCSKWKESAVKDYWSAALAVREARLQRRDVDSNDEQSTIHQKKLSRMHPSMYEDDLSTNQQSAEGQRSSKRLTLVKTSCHCCNSCSDDHSVLRSPCKHPLENGCREEELLHADSPATKTVTDKFDENTPHEKHVFIGPQYQADVPLWTGAMSESDPKWLGKQIWAPNFNDESSSSEVGGSSSCECFFPGSVECYRFHIAEKRMKLRREVGLAFYHWKFDRMGEEISLSWSIEEEKRFKHVIRLNRPCLGKSFFPRKTRMDLVNYYFNVYVIRRRSYQNRVTPKDVDSDDDETEIGAVSEVFGYNFVKVRGAEPVCLQNKQVTDLD